MRNLAFSLLLLVGCSQQPLLIVDLHTDLVPGRGFDTVRVLRGGVADVETGAEGDYRRGVRLPGFRVAPGETRLHVGIYRAGTEIIGRDLLYTVRADALLPVWLLASCRGRMCPGSGDPSSATECASGACVEPTCTDVEPAVCEPACDVDGDCRGNVDACGGLRCEDGRCVFRPLPGSCPGALCDPTLGCVGASPADAGPPLDASRCQPSEDCTNTADDDCDGAVDCSDTDCASACMRCIGVSCPECQTCEASTGSCVPADGAPCASGTCWGGSCCGGCWDGASCIAGTDTAQCGNGGGRCADCGPCAVCTAGGACEVPASGTGLPCSDGSSSGLCMSDGSCCTTCFVSGAAGTAVCLAAPGPECGVGTGGAYCTGCPACQNCGLGGLCEPGPDPDPVTGLGAPCPINNVCVSGACCGGCRDGAACLPGTATGACGVHGQVCNTSCSCTAAGICSFPLSVGTCTSPYSVTGPMAIPVDLCGRADTVTASCQPVGNPDFVIQNDSGVALTLRVDPLAFGWTFLMEGTCDGWACGGNFDRIRPGERMAVHNRGSGCGVVTLSLR